MGNSQSFIIAHFMNPALAAVYDLTSKVCYVACGFVSQTNGSFFALFSLTLSSGDKGKINNIFRNITQFLLLRLLSLAYIPFVLRNQSLTIGLVLINMGEPGCLL